MAQFLNARDCKYIKKYVISTHQRLKRILINHQLWNHPLTDASRTSLIKKVLEILKSDRDYRGYLSRFIDPNDPGGRLLAHADLHNEQTNVVVAGGIVSLNTRHLANQGLQGLDVLTNLLLATQMIDLSFSMY
jgi:hypothetical protein